MGRKQKLWVRYKMTNGVSLYPHPVQICRTTGEGGYDDWYEVLIEFPTESEFPIATAMVELANKE
jgi:hypothetical protein